MPRSNSIRGFAHLLLLYRASIKHPLITTTNPSMATIPTKDRDPLAFTAEENDAMRATKLLLLTKFKLPEEKISSHILAVTTMNCKCQPAVAAEKYAKWLKLVDEGMGIKSFGEVLDEVGLKGEKLVGSPYEVGLANVYYVCGRDKMDRAIMWIRSPPVVVGDEVFAVKTSIIFYVAIHADLTTLREGTSFVLDTTSNAMDNKHKNESKLMAVWQAMPTRPQVMLILGANAVKRFFFNIGIRFANIFIKQKMLERLSFGTMDDVRKEFDEDSMPTALGGKGGGVTTDAELIQWVINRLENFPTLPDLSSVVSTDTDTSASTSTGAVGVEEDLKKVSDTDITDDAETVSESGTVNNETVKENTVSL